MDLDADLLVLHALAVRKSGTAEQVAAVLGHDPAAVEGELARRVEAGDVLGARGLFMATPAGQARLDAAYPDAYAGVRGDERFTAAADRFEGINRRLLDLLTRWQTLSRAGLSVANDHSDPDYDAKIIDELGGLHERAEPVLTTFAGWLPRFGAYRDRLGAAYERALTGQPDFVSGVRVDSYHTVWHEAHEDLLRVLGRSREE